MKTLIELYDDSPIENVLATSGIAGSRNRASVRNRAAKLGIELIEWEDLSLDRLIARLRNQE